MPTTLDVDAAIKKTFVDTITNLYLGQDVANSQAIFKKQLEDLNFITTNLTGFFDAMSDLASVYTSNPTVDQEQAIANKTLAMFGQFSDFFTQQPETNILVNFYNDPDFSSFFIQINELQSVVNSFITDPTKASSVLTSTIPELLANSIIATNAVFALALEKTIDPR